MIQNKKKFSLESLNGVFMLSILYLLPTIYPVFRVCIWIFFQNNGSRSTNVLNILYRSLQFESVSGSTTLAASHQVRPKKVRRSGIVNGWYRYRYVKYIVCLLCRFWVLWGFSFCTLCPGSNAFKVYSTSAGNQIVQSGFRSRSRHFGPAPASIFA